MDRLTAFTSSRIAQEWPDLQPGELVIVQTPAGPKRAHYYCPCGCGVPIMLAERGAITVLDGDPQPYWIIILEADGTWTVNPSVLMTSPTGCRSHYFVRHSRVEWC